ncbi:MAG TPA: hypothetical protein PLE19_18195 [Planctomycetota bacterium]|nr:hypothetical protein [Planctomycetota bacterium]HRR80727.1 hypothetical protein [Planctomycetota bacterium]HRT96791.1 hypothetical protein [Planctomycetota bacterium]
MNTIRRARTYQLAITAFASIALAGSVPPPSKDPLTVKLVVPYRTVLEDELIRFSVSLQNDSEGKVPYIVDPFEAGGKQVFLKVERGLPYFDENFQTDSRPGHGQPVIRTIERDGNWDLVVKKASAVLAPGESVVWDGSRFDDTLFYITYGKPKSIQAQVLIGPGRWVSSERVPIKVVERGIRLSPVVFQEFYEYFSPTKKMRLRCPVKVHRVSIEGNEYLFSGGGGRICEVPKRIIPQFAWDSEARLLTVRFPGANLPPIRYDYLHMQVLPGQPAAPPVPRER